MFLVKFLLNLLYLSPSIIMQILDSLETLDNAYNCPCENTGWCRKMPTNFIVYPCALFIVIANAGRIGNCRRLNSNGNWVSLGMKEILGIKNSFMTMNTCNNFSFNKMCMSKWFTYKSGFHCINQVMDLNFALALQQHLLSKPIYVVEFLTMLWNLNIQLEAYYVHLIDIY